MPSILVVEDSGFTRRLMVNPLREAGYTVLEAEDGKQAFEIYQAQLPDCVITDLLVPVMSGLKLLRSLREAGSDVPVIVASADIQEASISKCRELGISSFLHKPVKADELLACLQGVLAHEMGVNS